MVKQAIFLLLVTGWALGASADIAKSGSAANPAHPTGSTDHTAGVKEHLAEQERLEKEAAIKAAAALRLKEADAATRERVLNQAGSKAPPPEDELARQVQAAIKEAARPVKEAVDAVRGPNDAPAAAKPSTQEPAAQTESQRRTNSAVDRILWEELVEQAKPWALGLGIAVVLLVAATQLVSHGRGKSTYRAPKDTSWGSDRGSSRSSGSPARTPSRVPSRSSARSTSRSSRSKP